MPKTSNILCTCNFTPSLLQITWGI